MPANFDIDDDLTFLIAGKTFTMELVSPEVLAGFEDEEDADTAGETIERLYDRIRAYLGEGDRDTWDKLRADGKISYRALSDLSTWALEVQTGRPTTRPEPSAPGPGRTAATSSAASRAQGARQAVRAKARR